MQGEKENAFRRMQDVERDRVTLKTENAVLTEKYHTARQELDDLKLRQATHFNEKLHEIEAQNKANKEELKRKEGQIIELNNCLLYTSPSPRDRQKSRMPSSA